MLWQRLLLGTLMILLLAGCGVFDGWVSERALAAMESLPPGEYPAPVLYCGLVITALAWVLFIAATVEFGRLSQLGGYSPATGWSAFVVLGLLAVPWVEMQNQITTGWEFLPPVPVELPLWILWLTGGLMGACLFILARKQTRRAVGNLGVTAFLMLYLGLMGSFLVRIRCLEPGAAGTALVFYCLLTVKLGDIGAFFTGKLLGKHKLVPWLSPGKTVEGGLGACLFAIGGAVGGMAWWEQYTNFLGSAPLNFTQALIFGVVMAIFGHLGDLVMSAVKRDVGSKDSGQIVPSFGGFLDLLDSPIFAAPVAWFLLTFWAAIG